MPEPQHPLSRRPEPAASKTQPKPRAGKTAQRPGAGSARRPKKAAGAKTAGKPRRRTKAPVGDGPPAGKVRIQKLLAEAGVASRRTCEEMVLDGRVRVNGDLVAALPCFVEPGKDRVTVDGRAIRAVDGKKVYVLLNKPKGVVCTNRDPAGRPRAVDLVADVGARLFAVGRLDIDSTGLILLTNDGELANRLTHPRYGVEKTYVVEVAGRMAGPDLETLKGGAYLDGKRTSRIGVKVLRRNAASTLLEVRLREGRNREIRRLIARLGYKVRALRRVAIGALTDRGVKTGNYRMLKPTEVKALTARPASTSGAPVKKKPKPKT